MAHTLLILAGSFGAIIAVGSLLVFLEDRLDASVETSGSGLQERTERSLNRGRLRLSPAAPAVVKRERRYEPMQFAAQRAATTPLKRSPKLR